MQIPDPTQVFWDDWLLLFVQAAGVVFLIIYVWKTWQMASATQAAAVASAEAVREAKDARLEALAPRVLVYFDQTDLHIGHIVIENVGAGTATDVTFEIEPPLQSPERAPRLEYFDLPKSVIPPGAKIMQFFTTWPKYLNSSLPHRYQVTVSYTGAENRRSYKVEQLLDVDTLRHRTAAERKGLHQLVSELERLRKLLERGIRDTNDHRWASLFRFRIEGFRDTNLQACLVGLRTTWRFAQLAAETEGVKLNRDALLHYLRREAMTALRAAAYERAPQEQAVLLQRLAIELWKFDGYGDQTWTSTVDAAFDALSDFDLAAQKTTRQPA